MSDLDATIARLKALPKGEQDAVAAQIDLMLDQGSENLLTPEQWAEIEVRLESDERLTPHGDIVRDFLNQFR